MYGFSRSIIQKYLHDSNGNKILVNSRKKKAHYLIKAGDRIEVWISEVKESQLEPKDIQLHILYEDDDLIVINKQPGIPVHPSYGHKNETIVNALLHYIGGSGSLSNIGGVKRPGIVHRLDKDTSGVLLIAKNNFSHTQISKEFSEKRVKKIYEAIVKGIISPKEGIIDKSIKRSTRNRKKFTAAEQGKEAVTYYETIDCKNETTWVRFRPKTGRTHQIRLHAASIGHPIIGDALYARKSLPVKYLALFAKELTITHPRTGKSITFRAPYPKHFLELGALLGYSF